jgi:hypothetical protein
MQSQLSHNQASITSLLVIVWSNNHDHVQGQNNDTSSVVLQIRSHVVGLQDIRPQDKFICDLCDKRPDV